MEMATGALRGSRARTGLAAGWSFLGVAALAFVLALRDWLFRTQYRDPDCYPATGIPDRDFPLERGASPRELLLTAARQLCYPLDPRRPSR
jgi:hypothetical protein